jgi:hypothetical protein
VLAANAVLLCASDVTVTFDAGGNTIGKVPDLRPGDRLKFKFDELDAKTKLKLIYEMPSDDDGDGRPLGCKEKRAIDYDPDKGITIPGEKGGKVQYLYFNLLRPANPAAAVTDQTALTISQDDYASVARQKEAALAEIAGKTDKLSELQEEIKAYAGMSVSDAFQAVELRQRSIQELRAEVNSLQAKFDATKYDDTLSGDTTKIENLQTMLDLEKQVKPVRAGVFVIGKHSKTVYYTLAPSLDAANPYSLKQFQEFPVFTTDDIPFVIVLGQLNGTDPQGLRASFTSATGTYLDVAKVRPVTTQAAASNFKVINPPAGCPLVLGDAMVDRLLTFTKHLAGEAIYSITVTGYAAAITTDTNTVTTGETPSTQHVTVTTKADLKVLDGDAWPQVHSLYRYNIATGVLWASLRAPSFSRAPTGAYVAGCVPTTSPTLCTPLYQTVRDPGGPRVLPALMFTIYPRKRDTQVEVQWKELIPAPTIGMSLTTPADDFFIGGSSEIKPLRNVQLVYGVHLGRVDKLGASSLQVPTDNTAPSTAKSSQKGVYLGLTFNIDFIKGLFGK